jgi:hypothetical protein
MEPEQVNFPQASVVNHHLLHLGCESQDSGFPFGRGSSQQGGSGLGGQQQRLPVRHTNVRTERFTGKLIDGIVKGNVLTTVYPVKYRRCILCTALILVML